MLANDAAAAEAEDGREELDVELGVAGVGVVGPEGPAPRRWGLGHAEALAGHAPGAKATTTTSPERTTLQLLGRHARRAEAQNGTASLAVSLAVSLADRARPSLKTATPKAASTTRPAPRPQPAPPAATYFLGATDNIER